MKQNQTRSGWGGARPGAGRKPGSPNKVGQDLRAAASKYTDQALQTLVSIMDDPQQPSSSRVAAAQALLDRSHGRPVQQQIVDLNDQRSYIRAPSKSTDEEWKQLLERRQALAESIAPKPKQPVIAPKTDGNQKPSNQLKTTH